MELSKLAVELANRTEYIFKKFAPVYALILKANFFYTAYVIISQTSSLTEPLWLTE